MYFRYADGQLAVLSRDASVLLYSPGRPIGVKGTTQNGDTFVLLRDGDYNDGALGPGIHDMSKYPYHLALMIWPASSGDSCEHSDSCRWYFAVGGEWNITSGSPFQGSFRATALTREENCWEEGNPVDTSACALLPGELKGCFHVPLGSP
ncbi:Hypothetical protein AA314_07924 [Archangium gephyra]|uniref:Uncharacterized protein n=1 Tax=Archangium gephyra TaxID=48 RepID=A0AAC8THN8_9BACT|nr:Hypothetical protein AA314_07924 [Archangium gephyra]